MDSISHFMTDDHRRCDDLYAKAEAAVNGSRWETAGTGFAQFRAALLRHFKMEEETLFPAFEEASGQIFGPTAMMRLEHTQMRELLNGMARSLEDRDRQAYLGIAETLLVLMQQHNFKEERVLYPMTDNVLGRNTDALLERMQGAETV
jgi:hemerythrin-like domain-containing protein